MIDDDKYWQHTSTCKQQFKYSSEVTFYLMLTLYIVVYSRVPKAALLYQTLLTLLTKKPDPKLSCNKEYGT